MVTPPGARTTVDGQTTILRGEALQLADLPEAAYAVTVRLDRLLTRRRGGPVT